MRIPDFLQKLFAFNQIRQDDGALLVLNKPCVFMPAQILVDVQMEMANELGAEKAKRFFYDAGKRRTKSGFKFFSSIPGLERTFQRLSVGKALFEFGIESLKATGWGRYELLFTDVNHSRLRVHNSPFARAYRSAYGTTEKHVCDFINGMLAGGLEFAHGGVYDGVEMECAASGKSNSCVFEIKRRSSSRTSPVPRGKSRS